MGKNKNPEADIQIAIVAWCRQSDNFFLRHIFAVSNGFNLREVGLRVKAVRMGQLAGMPDLCVMFPTKIVWLEVKAAGGSMSGNQRKIKQMLTDKQWNFLHSVHRVTSLEEAQKILLKEEIVSDPLAEGVRGM